MPVGSQAQRGQSLAGPARVYRHAQRLKHRERFAQQSVRAGVVAGSAALEQHLRIPITGDGLRHPIGCSVGLADRGLGRLKGGSLFAATSETFDRERQTSADAMRQKATRVEQK